MGGENATPHPRFTSVNGSSPRGRGKLQRGDILALPTGLIPAWAGKTHLLVVKWSFSTAHPRVGGENELFAVSPEDTPGSSPRGRGKPKRGLDGPEHTRLIPAWAGKTREVIPIARHHGAHPRVGGENP